jgi:mRNA-degrading endonuclease toxin of MazEF toxin-antitoxin module
MVDLHYIPNRGDLIWINLDPTLGSEQNKRRPALVLSPASYSIKTPLCLIVPVTSKIRICLGSSITGRTDHQRGHSF